MASRDKMKIVAIPTKNGNILVQTGCGAAYLDKNKNILRFAFQSEWEYISQQWGTDNGAFWVIDVSTEIYTAIKAVGMEQLSCNNDDQGRQEAIQAAFQTYNSFGNVGKDVADILEKFLQ